MSQVQKCGFLWELVGNDGAAAMFRGVNHINMDTKGRLTVPTRYRDEINSLCDGRMVATIDTEERCLLIYPQPAWDDIQRKVEALPSFNLAARRVQRLLIGHATDIPMDRNGRLLVTPPLREYARLSKNAVLLGQGNKLELWDEMLWTERREQWLDEESEAQLPEELKSLSL